jgi:hypothetical protein
VQEGDGLNDANEAMLQARRYVCDSEGSRAPEVEAEPGGLVALCRLVGGANFVKAVASTRSSPLPHAWGCCRSLAFHCPLDPPTTALSCTPARSSNNLIVAVLRKSVGCARQ